MMALYLDLLVPSEAQLQPKRSLRTGAEVSQGLIAAKAVNASLKLAFVL